MTMILAGRKILHDSTLIEDDMDKNFIGWHLIKIITSKKNGLVIVKLSCGKLRKCSRMMPGVYNLSLFPSPREEM